MMKRRSTVLLVSSLLLLEASWAFVLPSSQQRRAPLSLSAERKRRKRKESSTTSSIDDNPGPTAPPIQESAKLEIRDIRELTGQAVESSLSTSSSSSSASPSTTSQASNTSTTKSSTKNDDPLAQLLDDARAMQADNKDKDTAEEKSGLISQVLSTIITVDFFVVCGLLLWFLAGIFCSYILKDDTVQIAFNGIFEPVVQPALGVLMIASLSDAVLKPKEEKSD